MFGSVHVSPAIVDAAHLVERVGVVALAHVSRAAMSVILLRRIVDVHVLTATRVRAVMEEDRQNGLAHKVNLCFFNLGRLVDFVSI